jgi:hypothetical protein
MVPQKKNLESVIALFSEKNQHTKSYLLHIHNWLEQSLGWGKKLFRLSWTERLYYLAGNTLLKGFLEQYLHILGLLKRLN